MRRNPTSIATPPTVAPAMIPGETGDFDELLEVEVSMTAGLCDRTLAGEGVVPLGKEEAPPGISRLESKLVRWLRTPHPREAEISTHVYNA